MAIEIYHCVKLDESQQESDRSFCAPAQLKKLFSSDRWRLEYPQKLQKVTFKGKSDKYQQRERQKSEAQKQKCETGGGSALF